MIHQEPRKRPNLAQLNAISEDALFRAYRNAEPLRTVRCVCGGAITAPPMDEARIAFAVRGHQAQQRHQRWRGAMDF